MRMARSIVISALALVLFGPLAQAKEGAVVEPPIDLREADVTGMGGVLVLEDGTTSLLLSTTGGTVDVWTLRIPCVRPTEASCVQASSSRETRRIVLVPGPITIAPGPDAPDGRYQLFATQDPDSEVTLDASRAQVNLRTNDETLSHADTAEPAAEFNTISEPAGAVLEAIGLSLVRADGALTLSAMDATLDVPTLDDEGKPERESVTTGWSWEPNGLQYYYQLQLVSVEVEGTLLGEWDGRAVLTPELPLQLAADSATFDLVSGSLGNDASGAQLSARLSPFEATVVDVDLEAGQLFLERGLATTTPPPDDDAPSGTVLFGVSAAIAAVGGLGAFYWPRFRWGLTVLALPMYSRIEKSELFDNDVREQLYQFIQAEPGIHAHALSERAEIGWGTTVYHLRLLERNRLVTSQRAGRYRRFFPAAGFLARRREVLSVLQNDTTNGIARFILRQPGANQKTVCEAMGISPSLANWHLNRLLEAELVRRERHGRTVHYFPGEAWSEVHDPAAA